MSRFVLLCLLVGGCASSAVEYSAAFDEHAVVDLSYAFSDAMKIEQGTGGPCRIIAILEGPSDDG